MTLPVSTSGRARLRVDPIACDGRGICAELLPGLITLDDWGFPIIHGDVPPALQDEAAEAARLCPKLALRLTAGHSESREAAPGDAPARPAADGVHARRLPGAPGWAMVPVLRAVGTLAGAAAPDAMGENH